MKKNRINTLSGIKDKFIESIRKARREYALGDVFTHEQAFGKLNLSKPEKQTLSPIKHK